MLLLRVIEHSTWNLLKMQMFLQVSDSSSLTSRIQASKHNLVYYSGLKWFTSILGLIGHLQKWPIIFETLLIWKQFSYLFYGMISYLDNCILKIAFLGGGE